MPKLFFSLHACFLTFALVASNSFAQTEVLSPAESAHYRSQLPEATKSATSPPLKSYLQTLSPEKTDAKIIANAVRVAADVANHSDASDAFLACYTVPTLSPLMRLADTYPSDGRYGGEIRAVLAQDEYENASFQLFSFADKKAVELVVSDLKNEKGVVFPKNAIDLKVVKIWYQNGNAWLSYFADPGLKLVPELLLHDENLIRVDTKNPANYARIRTKKESKEVWISQPQKLDIGFDAYQEGFADAETLQPVALQAGAFKQFVLTVHADKNTAPGIYRGSVIVTSGANEKNIALPLAIKVLPFVLPLPKTNYDINKDFLVHLMGAWPKGILPEHEAFLPILKNLRAHNILHTGPDVDRVTPPEQAALQVRLFKEAGFLEKPIYGALLPGGGSNKRPPISFDDQMNIEHLATWYHDFYKKNFGHTDVFMKSGDEQGVAWLITQRPIWRIEHRYGLKSYLAGHIRNYFPTSAYILDGRPTAGYPTEREKPELWNQIGDGYTGFYAGQHNGSENPAFVRREHGLLGYLSNFDMVDNYEFAYGPWNDRAYDLYKPMVLAYPTSKGLVDTLAWEGFREGIDDIRYATKLRQLADEAIASGDIDRMDAGKKVRQWFAQMDGTTIDLNTIRSEMIRKIEQLAEQEKSISVKSGSLKKTK